MKGLELSRKYYETCGKPMLKEQFPDLFDVIAVGLFGSGSECYGYDDDLSQDHDFEPGFCIFLPCEDIVSEERAFALSKAYNKLPKEFEGYQRSLFLPAEGSRHGVFRLSEYLDEKIGVSSAGLSLSDWFTIPEYLFSELTNGEIFHDPSRLLIDAREKLSELPTDVWKKKMAWYLKRTPSLLGRVLRVSLTVSGA